MLTITKIFLSIGLLILPYLLQAQQNINTASGIIQGVEEKNGIISFKGIPYAQAPVGELRWKAPQPLQSWKGIYKANYFGDRSFQQRKYDDMVFRSTKASEDCLYLNIWSPAKGKDDKLPVLIYFHGGGFSSGDGSEWRYDGESMASKGIIAITVNYRLGVFGFLAHPELSMESSSHSSGNYGLMDQNAAIKWVHDNIAAFGGDPAKVTIAGESAGSMSVSAQMASPLSKGLFSAAIGESGSVLGRLLTSLSEAEKNGLRFMKAAKVGSINEMRQMKAEDLSELSLRPGLGGFPVTVDGYFFTEQPVETYSRGQQMDIPLLAGWNSAEVTYHNFMGSLSPTMENFKAKVKEAYGSRAGDVLNQYKSATDTEAKQSATDIASDRFINFGTWKWIDLHSKTNGHFVYRYLFSKMIPTNGNSEPLLGTPHAREIEYALGNLPLNKFYNWTADDFKVSSVFQSYLVNFLKTRNPNGSGLPQWFGLQSSIPKVQIIDTETKAEPEKNLRRYQLLDEIEFK